MRSAIARASALVLAYAALTACFSNNVRPPSRYSSVSGGTTVGGGVTTSTTSFVISNVVITAPGPSPSPGATSQASIFFDTTKSTGTINNVCNLATDSTQAPCVCQFSWQEVNQNGGNAVQIPRSVQTQVTLIQPNVVVCAPPDVYSTEIVDGTSLKISVLPGVGNPNQFTVTPFTYLKNSVATPGSFQDYLGRSFQNIIRYACYEQYLKGMNVQSRQGPALNDPNGNSVTPYMASAFCAQKADGTGGTGQGCTGLPGPDYSSQANYFNFYIRESERGDINLSNDRYVCPQVQEAITGNGGVGTQGLTYPQDSTFALSMAPSVDFPVGVEAFSKLSNGGSDPTSTSSGCYPAPASSGTPGGGSSSSSSTSGFIKSCLGFASLPANDGSCPYIRNSSGQIVFTYRLRRFVTLFPEEYDGDGHAIAQPQLMDTIYVLDRPVNSPNADPLKPYTMAGPKPCPFSYYDRASVASQSNTTDPITGTVNFFAGGTDSNGNFKYPGGDGFVPWYFGTSNTRWNGKSVDGVQFPNWDGMKNNVNACSAVMPLVSPDKATLSLATVNKTFQSNPALKNVWVRPITSWTPHFIEDTTFQACAPLPSNFRDPPLHFMKDTQGNVSWCAEVYPTQNPNISALDTRTSPTTPYFGFVRNYTSHARKGSKNTPNTNTGPQCTATQITTITPATYPQLGVNCDGVNFKCEATHPNSNLYVVDKDNTILDLGTPGNNIVASKTCDRTVTTPGLSWGKFPLLAPAYDTEAAISGDSSYNCSITWDNNSGKAGLKTPTGGCCGANVLVVTGAAEPKAAHLEPDEPCLTPTY